MTMLSQPIRPSEESLSQLQDLLVGRVLRPGTADYAALATPWNVAAASEPVAVVEATSPDDVSAAIRFANRHGLKVSVQCTGHGAWSYADPTLLIYTGLFDEVSIDPASRHARVGAGVTWSQVLDAAAEHGLAALAGSAPGVGVVGYLTGGGLSPVARTFGFASDYVSAFDLVTGDGEIHRATATQNAELFWALRGGKGALGIVTSVEFALFPITEIYGGCLYFDGDDAANVVNAWRTWTQSLPAEASTSLAILRLPEMPMVPPPLAGRCTVAVRFAWVGDPGVGARWFEPMRQVAPVLLGGVDTMPFAALGAIHADPVDPMPVHEAATLLREFNQETQAALLATAGPQAESPQVIVELRLLGGRIADAPAQTSAVSHRDAAFTLLSIGIAAPPIVDFTVAHSRALLRAVAPWSTGTAQPNFGASSDPALTRRKYDAATLHRLVKLSAVYDPNSVLTASLPLRRAAELDAADREAAGQFYD